MYVTGDSAAIRAYDVATQVVTDIPSPVVGPRDVAITTDGTTMVVTGRSDLGVIDIANPAINARIPIGGTTTGISIP